MNKNRRKIIKVFWFLVAVIVILSMVLWVVGPNALVF